MPLPCFSSLPITDLMTCSGLRMVKSNESMSVEKIAMLRSPRYLTISGGCRSAGNRKNGAVGPPTAMCTALAPISISRMASSLDFFDRSACDQVWVPIEWPAAATCLRIPGSQVACLPIGKNVALTQCEASAASTAGVFFGHGPSSNVSTTSLLRRKSCSLKCSNPKPGPPVVSTSTMRDVPSAFGLLAHPTVAVFGVGTGAFLVPDGRVWLAAAAANPTDNASTQAAVARIFSSLAPLWSAMIQWAFRFASQSRTSTAAVDSSANRPNCGTRASSRQHPALSGPCPDRNLPGFRKNGSAQVAIASRQPSGDESESRRGIQPSAAFVVRRGGIPYRWRVLCSGVRPARRSRAHAFEPFDGLRWKLRAHRHHPVEAAGHAVRRWNLQGAPTREARPELLVGVERRHLAGLEHFQQARAQRLAELLSREFDMRVARLASRKLRRPDGKAAIAEPHRMRYREQEHRACLHCVLGQGCPATRARRGGRRSAPLNLWQAIGAKMRIPERDHPISIMANPKRVRVLLGGKVVADSRRALTLREASLPPVQYIPREDADLNLLNRTEHATHCPYKGDASYFTVSAGGRMAENAAWSYEQPFPAVAAIAGRLAFYPERVDSIEELPA